jgi:hypothetical protein
MAMSIRPSVGSELFTGHRTVAIPAFRQLLENYRRKSRGAVATYCVVWSPTKVGLLPICGLTVASRRLRKGHPDRSSVEDHGADQRGCGRGFGAIGADSERTGQYGCYGTTSDGDADPL